jgi:hypothetical protein
MMSIAPARYFGRPSKKAAAAAVNALADDAPTTTPTVPTTPAFWNGELKDAKSLIGRKVIRQEDNVYMGTIIEVLDNVYFCALAYSSITEVHFMRDDGSIHTENYY